MRRFEAEANYLESEARIQWQQWAARFDRLLHNVWSSVLNNDQSKPVILLITWWNAVQGIASKLLEETTLLEDLARCS